MKAVVCGAGIGGVAAACALHDQGVDVEVFDQAPELSAVGAGIQVSPNFFRVLRALGVDGEARRLFHPPRRHDVVVGKTGDMLTVTEYNSPEARHLYGEYPYMMAHRGDMLRLLVAAARRRGIVPRLGERLLRVDRGSGDGPVAVFASAGAVRGDVVVGADGIKSVCREYVAGGDAGRPRFTGNVAYRCLMPLSRVAHLVDDRNVAYFGPGRSLVGYKVHAPGAREEQYNCVFLVRHPKRRWESEDWNYPAAPAELREEFAGFCPTVRALIDQIETCAKWAVFDRAPLPTWRRGRVVLLGDAAHAMQPFLAQGAAQSVEDAVALARCVAAARGGSVPLDAALAAYERARKPRTTRVQQVSAHSEKVFHCDGAEAAARDARMRSRSPADNLRNSEWLYKHDVDEECARCLRDGGATLPPPHAPRL